MAGIEHTTAFQATAGLAKNPDGTLADVPRTLAAHMHNQLLHVVTLLHSVCEAVPEGKNADEADADGMTSPSSRTVALAAIADEKVRSIVRALSPYV
jgi:hypothetical protein